MAHNDAGLGCHKRFNFVLRVLVLVCLCLCGIGLCVSGDEDTERVITAFVPNELAFP